VADFAVIVRKVESGALSILRALPRMMAAIAEYDDAKDLREVKAQAAAVAAYLAQKNDMPVAEYNAAMKLKARAEHRLGEVLAVTVNHKGGGDRRSPYHGDTVNRDNPPEITRMQSSRAQQLARVAWEAIEEAIDILTKADTRAAPSRVIKELLQERQREDNKALVNGSLPLAEVPGRFRTIVVDPPWDWDDEGDASQFGRGRHEYKAMSFEELLAFPLAEKAAKNCHLYLWVTNRSLPKAFSLAEAWGFRYVVCLTWCKPTFGMGNYFRGSTEHVLFCVRGSQALLRNDVGTYFMAARGKAHSAKPDEFFALVESCSPGPWLEVFSCAKRPGWVTWGAEVNGAT